MNGRGVAGAQQCTSIALYNPTSDTVVSTDAFDAETIGSPMEARGICIQIVNTH